MTFDIDLVKNSFKKCHENELNIPAYLTGYSELYNFFNVLGSVFGFVASDVKEKIDILVRECFCSSLYFQFFLSNHAMVHFFVLTKLVKLTV